MKKLLLVCISLACTGYTFANDNAAKLQIVKQIYSQGGNNGHNLLMRNATKDLKSVFQEDEYSTPDGDIGCIDYDVTIQGQDFSSTQIKRTLKTSPLPNGNIAVSFKNFNTPVKLTYVMKCSSGRCQIDDILEHGKSFKHAVRQCIANH